MMVNCIGADIYDINCKTFQTPVAVVYDQVQTSPANQKKIYSDVKWLPIEKTVKCEILAKLSPSRGLCEW